MVSLEMYDRVLENYGSVAFGKFQFSLAGFSSKFACGLHVFHFFKEGEALGMTPANMADVEAIDRNFTFFFYDILYNR